MRIDVLTLFPAMFEGPMTESMMFKAREHDLLDLRLHQIRDYAIDKHRAVDDTPYGGGGGMVMRADVLVNAVETVVTAAGADPPIILMSPQGRLLSHTVAAELAQYEQLVVVCGHYEGVDERVRKLIITDEISIGDYVLTGGELAAMVMIDAVMRHLPGLLGAQDAHQRDSHADGLLEGPHYTRPALVNGLEVPDVLRGGDHQAIARWRREQALARTWHNRPDLLLQAQLSEDDKYHLASLASGRA